MSQFLEPVLYEQLVTKKPVLETPKPQLGMVLITRLAVSIPIPKSIHFALSGWPMKVVLPPPRAGHFVRKKGGKQPLQESQCRVGVGSGGNRGQPSTM